MLQQGGTNPSHRRHFPAFHDAAIVLNLHRSLKTGLGCDIRKNFAIAFKKWRQRNSYLLKQIAADLGVSVNTVNLWEMGRLFPDGKNIERLSEYTGLPPCRLFCLMAAKCTRSHCLLKKNLPA